MRELSKPETAARDLTAAVLTRSLGFESTEVRNRDALDFHEVSVVGQMKALRLAWTDGFAAGEVPLLAALRAFVEWNDQDQGEGKLEDALHVARGLLARAEG